MNGSEIDKLSYLRDGNPMRGQGLYAAPNPVVKNEPIRLDVRVSQPMYGVPNPVEKNVPVSQADYAVKNPVRPWPGGHQALYAVPNPSPINGTDINVTYSKLEENIATLKSAISKLKSSWSSEIKKNVSILDNSWVGQDCEVYTSKLTNMDSKVQKTISALELLCSTYEKARDMVKDNQSLLIGTLRNLD